MEGRWTGRFPFLSTFVDYWKKGFLLTTFPEESLILSRFSCPVTCCDLQYSGHQSNVANRSHCSLLHLPYFPVLTDPSTPTLDSQSPNQCFNSCLRLHFLGHLG